MKKWLIRCIILFGVGAAAFAAWRLIPQHRTFYTDAESIREPAESSRPRDILWEPPRQLPAPINSGVQEYEPRISADGMTMFFVRGKAGGDAEVFIAARTANGWGEPQPIAAINSDADDLGPQPSPDGNILYFYSNRMGGLGGYDLWSARRRDDGEWQPAENLGAAVNSEFNDYGPAITPDGRTLYFSSNRPQPDDARTSDPNAWSATLREDLFHRTYDLYSATMTDRGPGKAEAISELNTPYNEGAPAVSSFGDFLYFASDRPGGEGAFDLYRSRRRDGKYEPAKNLGKTVNTPANELDPALSMGGFGLDFSSDRIGEDSSDSPRAYRLYHTNSREVFVEAERVDRPPMDWAGLWKLIGPNLLWALIALLLLLFMLSLFKAAQNRKLSLLARCLLASLAAHILLMLLFNVWEVAAALAGEAARRGSIQIALTSPSADSIAEQIRGRSLDVPSPVVAAPPIERRMIPLTALAEPEQTEIPPDQHAIEIITPMSIESSASDARIVESDLMPKPTVELAESQYAIEVSLPSIVKPTKVDEGDLESSKPPTLAPSSRRLTSDISNPRFSETVRIDDPPRSDNVADELSELSLAPEQSRLTEAIPATESKVMTANALAKIEPLHFAEPQLPMGPVRQSVVESPHRAEDSMPLPEVGRAPMADSFNVGTTEAMMESPRPDNPVATDSDVRLVDSVSNIASDAPRPLDSPAEFLPAALPDSNPRPMFGLRLALAHFDQLQPTPEASPFPLPVFVPLRRHSYDSSNDMKETKSSEADEFKLPPMDSFDMKVSDLVSAPGVESGDAPVSPSTPPSSVIQFVDSTTNLLPLSLAIPGIVEAESEQPIPKDVEIGRIRGKVTDDLDGRPVGGARVQLVLPDREPLTATTDAKGRYFLSVPLVPENFALSASLEGFVPASANVSRAAIERNGSVTVDFSLERSTPEVVATEAAPDVHHLGDDRFDGTINSQFQKKSEGSSFLATFEVDGATLRSALVRAEIRLFVKGVQRRHRIFINNRPLPRRLDESPEDGSFGEFIAPFDPDMLHEGVNTLRIVAAPSSDDIDDFEFVNIRIHLIPVSPLSQAGL